MAQRLVSGDESVLADVLRALGPRVESWFRNKYPWLRIFEEDIAADALSRLWRCREMVRPSEPFTLLSLYFKLSRQAAADLIRLRWQQARMHERQYGSTDYAAPPATSIPRLDACRKDANQYAARLRGLIEVLAGLSDRDRQIILHYATNLEGRSWTDELTQELAMTPNAIRRRRQLISDRIVLEMRRRGHLVPESP